MEEPATEEPQEVISEDELNSNDGDEASEGEEENDTARMQPEVEDSPPLCVNNDVELSDEQQDKLAALKERAAEAVEVYIVFESSVYVVYYESPISCFGIRRESLKKLSTL